MNKKISPVAHHGVRHRGHPPTTKRQHDPLGSEQHGEDEDPEFTIEIPGSKAIFNPKASTWRRVLWVLLALIFLCLAIAQVQERIHYYTKTPVDVDLKVSSNDTLLFPRITLCTREPFNYTAMEQMRQPAASKLGVTPLEISLPYDLVSLMPLDVLWTRIAHKIDIMTRECWFGRNRSCADSGKWRPIFTILGPCYYYEADFPVRETGLFNGLYMQMEGKTLTKPKLAKDQGASMTGFSLQQASNQTVATDNSEASLDVNTDGWAFYMHDAKTNPGLAVYFGDYMYPSSSVDVALTLKEFSGIDTWHTPCVAGENYTVANCELRCLSTEVVQRVGCRLPYMLSDGPLCNTSSSYREADAQVQLLVKANQWNVADCNCTRQCNSATYTNNKEKVYADVKPDRLRFRVYFNDKTYEDVSETLAYSLIGLFCDIGNSIGLLLGASVLTLFQMFEWGGYMFQQYWMKGSKPKSQAPRAVPQNRNIQPASRY